MPRKNKLYNGNGNIDKEVPKEEYVNKNFKCIIRPKNEEQKNLLDTIHKNVITFVDSPAGCGKCINPETSYIFSESGIRLFKEECDFSDEYKTSTSKVINRDGEIENTDLIYNSGLQNTKIITTKMGYSIEGTLNHRVLCLSKNGIEWKELDQIKENDYVCINRKCPEVGVDSVTDDEIETAYFLGIMIGDGSYTLKNTFSFSSIDAELISFFSEYCKKNFGINPKRSRSRPCDYLIYSKDTRQKVAELGLYYKENLTKFIPSNLLNKSGKILGAVLQGLFDTDGTVSKHGIVSFTNKSEILCKQIHLILLRLGILSSIKLVHKKYNGVYRPYYLITIIQSGIVAFREKVGFKVKFKRERLDISCDYIRNTNVDVIPSLYISDVLKEYYKNFDKQDKTNRNDFRYYMDGSRSPSYSKLKTLYAKWGSKYKNKNIEELIEKNYFFDPIISTVEAKNKVYDYHVPQTHSFVANGFINHNTFLAAYYGINLLLHEKISSMVITRPAMEAGEKLGHLPGEIENKFSVYIMPIFDALSQIITEDQIKSLCKRNGDPSKIKMLPIAYMRGLSFRNTYVLVDEAQNTSPEQLRMVLTRIGEDSKIVVVGDMRQSDIKYTTNGLKDAIERFSDVSKLNKGIGIVKMTSASIVRHPIIKIIEEAYEKKQDFPQV